MRNAFIVSFLANVVLSLASLVILPDRVAIHFGLGGAPDGWASNLTSMLLVLGVHTLVFCALYFSPRLISTVPSKWISLPNRDFWLTPQRRHLAAEKLSHHMWRFSARHYFCSCSSRPFSRSVRIDLIRCGLMRAYS